jgi:hypothetical protein
MMVYYNKILHVVIFYNTRERHHICIHVRTARYTLMRKGV